MNAIQAAFQSGALNHETLRGHVIRVLQEYAESWPWRNGERHQFYEKFGDKVFPGTLIEVLVRYFGANDWPEREFNVSRLIIALPVGLPNPQHKVVV